MNTLVKGILFSHFLLSSICIFSQKLDLSHFNKYEVAQVSVQLEESDLNSILSYNGIYLDHGSSKEKALLYITKEGYKNLLINNIEYSWIIKPKPEITMMDLDEYNKNSLKSNCMPPMDFYPSYEVYEQMMLDFEEKYPDICEIVELGTLSSGRKILAAHIGDNLGIIEEEPNFLYTSTMHGDELAGFPILLMYIDTLLCNYGSDSTIMDIVNNINIYINPLANPDGTYRGGNNTVEQAIRFNNQFVDLNRNFPDPLEGPNPDGRNHQEETRIFMEFAQQYDIHLSCNIHSGVEVCNYPWDTFAETHADDDWWIDVTRDYANIVHTQATQGYLRDFNNGITNGFEWFRVVGGRQDYMTFFHRAREFTLEISSDKILDSKQLPNIWAYNKDALLNYMKASIYGLHGTIRDCVTGLPIEAEIYIPNHDKLNSSVFTSDYDGSYYRYLAEGQYNVMVIAQGYDTLSSSITIVDKSSVRFDGELCPLNTSSKEQSNFKDVVLQVSRNKVLLNSLDEIHNGTISIYSISGHLQHRSTIIDKSIDLNQTLNSGIYLIALQKNKTYSTYKIFIKE